MAEPPVGLWEGSVIMEDHIDYVLRMCMIPSEEWVEARVPRNILEFYGLQMHHLGPNLVLYLACFAMLCEWYLGFWSFSSLLHVFFNFRMEKNEEVSYSCSSLVVHAR
ncbi:hypothetical protein D1007_09599 [Hordeum vulgare]|nr:hypothetical protein D1007_09599 [Hordeum vulgare]